MITPNDIHDAMKKQGDIYQTLAEKYGIPRIQAKILAYRHMYNTLPNNKEEK